MFFRKRQPGAQPVVRLRGKSGHALPLVKNFRLEGALARNARLDADGAPLRVRIEPHVIDVPHGHAFQPYALPDARGAGIEAAERFFLRGLFSAGHVLAQIVVHRHREDVFPLSVQRRPRVQGKGCVPARMPAEADAVQSDLRAVIDGAETKHDALLAPEKIGQNKGPPIEAVGDAVCEGQPRKLRFRAIRNADFVRFAAERNLPFSVEEKKFVPPQLRFGMSDRLFHDFSSFAVPAARNGCFVILYIIAQIPPLSRGKSRPFSGCFAGGLFRFSEKPFPESRKAFSAKKRRDGPKSAPPPPENPETRFQALSFTSSCGTFLTIKSMKVSGSTTTTSSSRSSTIALTSS